MSDSSLLRDKNRKKFCGHKRLITNLLKFFVS